MAIVVKMEYTKEIEDIKSKTTRGFSVRGIKEGMHPAKAEVMTRNLKVDDDLLLESQQKMNEILAELELGDSEIAMQDHPNFPSSDSAIKSMEYRR